MANRQCITIQRNVARAILLARANVRVRELGAVVNELGVSWGEWSVSWDELAPRTA